MTKEQLLDKYTELSLLADGRRKEIINISSNSKNPSDAKLLERIKQLESEERDLVNEANRYLSLYDMIDEEEKANNQELINVKDSSSLGESKTDGPLETDMQFALNEIEKRVLNKEITQEEADRLSHEVTLAYVEASEENSKQMYM